VKHTIVLDDIDAARGEQVIADRTFHFGWLGQWYSVDLSTAHGQELYDLLGPYMAAGLKMSTVPRKESQDPVIQADRGSDSEPGETGTPETAQPGAPVPQPAKPKKQAAPAPEDAAAPGEVPVRMGVPLAHAVGMSMMKYKGGLREWAAGPGKQTIGKDAAGYIYTEDLFRGYERYLTAQDRRQEALAS
jgi:hypothetical protein